MESPSKPSSTSLFQVYLRLRPPPSPLVQLTQQSLYPTLPPPERYLTVEDPVPDIQDGMPTDITLHPPSDSRKRAVERFTFTKVFEEQTEQLDIFKGTGIVPLIEGVLGESRDGLVATLGVTGSGKSHTILGSKTQRGLTQLSLDLLFRSLDRKVLHPNENSSLLPSLTSADPSEAQILGANAFLENIYGDASHSHNPSRAQTPMTVRHTFQIRPQVPLSKGPKDQWSILGLERTLPRYSSPKTVRLVARDSPDPISGSSQDFNLPRLDRPARRLDKEVLRGQLNNRSQDNLHTPCMPKRKPLQRPSALPQFPDVSNLSLPVESRSEFAIVVSMYEVYNDRIFDLLSIPSNQKDLRRRHLLFKPTEASPDRKVVAGLRKIVCGTYEEALMVLETGLVERRVAGTGSNSVSSRSHGFFCVEVKRRPRGGMANSWTSANMTIVDLAGSERARNAKTAGATLAEAGKINESLMYLGQCLQMQSDNHDNTKPSLVPFRQCKLTELLFSNSFPSSNSQAKHHSAHHHRNPQKAIMIVTADPLGDFNATSQILRYSALAREVTVPRIPSVSSTILAGSRVPSGSERPGSSSGNSNTTTLNNGEVIDSSVVEMAFSELARLNEEVEILALRLNEESTRRSEAEENWQHAESKAETIETEVREEMWGEMEVRLDEERRRWKASWSEEADRQDEHVDRKLEILTKGMTDFAIYEDDRAVAAQQSWQQHSAAYAGELEAENQSLRAKLEQLERQVACASSPSKLSKQQQISISDDNNNNKENTSSSPTKKKKVAKTPARLNLDSSRDVLVGATPFKLNGMSLSSHNKNSISSSIAATASPDDGRDVEASVVVPKTPGTARKIRKLTARKWDLLPESELEAYENFS